MKCGKQGHQITATSSAGGMMQEGALTLGGCMWSLTDLYAVGFTGVIRVSSGYFLALGQMTYSHSQNRIFV